MARAGRNHRDRYRATIRAQAEEHAAGVRAREPFEREVGIG